MADSSARQITNHRLDSWKEIAAFFDRDERTVRRWEKERGLPVHRVPGGGRGGVFAYPAELKDWLKGRAGELQAELATIPAVTEFAEIENQASFEPSSSPFALAPVLILPPAPPPRRPSIPRIVAWLAPLIMVSSLIALLSFSHREPR